MPIACQLRAHGDLLKAKRAIPMCGSSIYCFDPDGAQLELISDPLGEMYGNPVI